MYRLFAITCVVCAASFAAAQEEIKTLEALGERLFFDENLSANRTQSCATCHDPEYGFADPRGMASIGDDGESLGDRNAPTASYAAFIPAFHRGDDGVWLGGQFWDGRAPKLEDQAGGPPLNPIEMGMKDAAAVVARLNEDPVYQQAFSDLFEAEVLQDASAGYTAMTAALAAFERTEVFAPFDSKYDRFLRGEATLTSEEELGRVLFFSEQFTNCNLCHQIGTSAMDPRETFTNHEFHNIGIPENTALRAMNGVAPGTVDAGLAANPAVQGDPMQLGKFRTPTLRNVAVTGPYMHNGVFEDLRTVVLFYNRFNTRSEARQINPETGERFGSPAVPQTLAVKELTHGPALDDRRVDAIVAFLKTLTDARYEHLLEE
ncbi:cytochrome-c peroxidase [Shimia marina]|uniref:Methylamine utilization protein MauG n=1 Tax=Shimia marina TaxID=321267 RepID=A0A0P1FAC2_9RHOB|nr:cytochrome c peroxidase [Shimia marina]CUH51607.1 Methylamine utilization protein MauG precursor [Shimia marina]SFD44808.1 Cytochrome c peroxidase [Shimia marina]